MPAPRQTTLDGFIGRLAAIGSTEITRHVAVAIDKTTIVARDRMRDATRRTLGHTISGPGGLSGSRTPPDYTVNAIRARQANWRSVRDGDDITGDVHVAADHGSHNNDQSAYLKFQFGEGSQVRFPGDVGLANTRILVWNPLDILLTTKIGLDPYRGGRQPRGLLGKLGAMAERDISTGTKSEQMRRIAGGSALQREAPLTSLAHRLQVARATIGVGGLAKAIAHAGEASGTLDRKALTSGLRASVARRAIRGPCTGARTSSPGSLRGIGKGRRAPVPVREPPVGRVRAQASGPLAGDAGHGRGGPGAVRGGGIRPHAGAHRPGPERLMARSRHKPNKRGRQPGQRPPDRPADPILAAAAGASNAKPQDDGFVPEPVVAEPEVVVPTVEERAPALNTRTARGMSLNMMAQVLKLDRSVIEGWTKRHGCPTLADANGKGTGNDWSLDIAAVFACRIDHERRTVLSEFGGEGMDMGDRIKLLTLAEKAKKLAPIAFFEARNRRSYTEFKQSLMAIGDRVGRTIDGLPKDKVDAWVEKIGDRHREALDRLRSQHDLPEGFDREAADAGFSQSARRAPSCSHMFHERRGRPERRTTATRGPVWHRVRNLSRAAPRLDG